METDIDDPEPVRHCDGSPPPDLDPTDPHVHLASGMSGGMCTGKTDDAYGIAAIHSLSMAPPGPTGSPPPIRSSLQTW